MTTNRRNLVCVSIPEGESTAFREKLSPTWNITTAGDPASAHASMRCTRMHVGVLWVEDTSTVDVDEFASLLRGHRGMQWIGVFPAGIGNHPAWRELIVDSLVDFHTMPVDLSRLTTTIGHTYGMARLLDQTKSPPATAVREGIVGNSPAMSKLQRDLRKVATVDAPVLILGESGSGKELTAQQLHRYSPRAGGPFVPVNCGAIPAALIQSELFGYERGAFTGAAQSRQGMFESAAGGTLFLDEIADLSLELQTNLLRFLQERTINRVGSTQSIRVDVRIIAATNVDLEEAVRKGRFREDLFYRLNVLLLTVPPLRDRREDIVSLAQHFFAKFEAEKNARLLGFSTAAVNAMETHAWPGNVRELINRVRRAMVMAEGRLIRINDLGLERHGEARAPEELGPVRINAERLAILSGLHRTHRNISQTARDLGISRMTLYRLMAKHDISP